MSGQKTEKHRLIVDHVVTESPADLAEIRKVSLICIWPALEILVLMAYRQKPSINTHADIFSWARGLNLGPES